MTGASARSEHVAVLRLLGSLVGDHLVLEANKHLLHGVVGFPLLEQGELVGLNGAVVLVDGGQVDLGHEVDGGGHHGVLGTAFDGQEEDTVVEVGVGGSNDGSIPLGEGLVVTLVETVRHTLV